MRRIWIRTLLIILILSACGDEKPTDDKSKSTPETAPTVEIEVTPFPTLTDELREQLESTYSVLSEVQAQIETVWSDLQAGRTVDCAAALKQQISPDALSSDDPISLILQQAAIEVQTAVNLWQAECQNPRPQPPPDVIDRGIRAALAAGTALDAASVALSQ
ncbi:MAG: hypothetical protein HND46_16430 [Chloroflexi bacterium]|nr:hypothetical protein [Chloroflexota bacterium]NOG65001.1 hypothetical protein [Chloroflexota bacterium]